MSLRVTCPHCGQRQPAEPGGKQTCSSCERTFRVAAITSEPPAVVVPTPEEEDHEEREVTLSGSVTTAGIIWIVFGALILINYGVLLAILGTMEEGESKEALIAGGMCGGLVAALFGGAFIFVGVQSVQGTAPDTLGNGIGSLVFAVLLGAEAVLRLTTSGGLLPALINLVLAGGLCTAGVLALNGRSQYKAYRRARKASSRRDDASETPRPRPRRH